MRLVAENLSGARGGETLFAGLDFALEPGEALAVSGPNGAGKTTLLRIAAGLLPPARGRIMVEGSARLGAASHFLSTQNAMKPTLSVEENLRFWARFLGEEGGEASESRALDALDAVGLLGTAHLPFAVLSNGQKRRVGLARLLLQHRPLWILDEPTLGLDAASEKRFAALLGAHLAGGGLALVATHAPLGLGGMRELRLGPAYVEAHEHAWGREPS